MSKRSIATVRRRPVSTAIAASGPLHVRSETIVVTSDDRVQIIDLTPQVMDLVHQLGVREGLANVFSMHTTATVFINEYQAALITDITAFLETLVPRAGRWRHNDPAFSDCDRMNADSHLRAMALGHSLTLPVSGGEVVLGQWQRVLLAELDGPRTRTVRIAVMGV